MDSIEGEFDRKAHYSERDKKEMEKQLFPLTTPSDKEWFLPLLALPQTHTQVCLSLIPSCVEVMGTL